MRERQEAEEMLSLPMQTYLMKHVVPALTLGMEHVVRLRPEDPVDALAEFLFHFQAKSQI